MPDCDHTNPPERVVQYFSELEKAVGDLEKVCSQCGSCCFATVQVDKSLVTVPELPCKFLMLKSDGKYSCSVYSERFQKAPWCRDLLTGAISGAYPEECNYMKGYGDYQGSKILNTDEYLHLRPQIQGVIGESLYKSEPFHTEDFDSFNNTPLFGKSIKLQLQAATQWLKKSFPQLPDMTVENLRWRLIKSSGEKAYLTGCQNDELIRSFIESTVPELQDFYKGLNTLIPQLGFVLGIDVSSDLVKAVNVSQAYRLVLPNTSSYEACVMNKWLLEKAVPESVLKLVVDGWWFKDDNGLPSNAQSAVLGKALDLVEVGVVDLMKDTNPIIADDLSMFSALVKSCL